MKVEVPQDAAEIISVVYGNRIFQVRSGSFQLVEVQELFQKVPRGSPEYQLTSLDEMPPRISSPKAFPSSIRLSGPSIWQRLNQTPYRHFSSSESQCYPRKPRNNPRRGMSAIRGTGIPPWIKLSVTTTDLRSNTRTELPPQESPNHGLWGFFNKGKTILTVPYDETQHGMDIRLVENEEQYLILSAFRTRMGGRGVSKKIIPRLALAVVGLHQGEKSHSNRALHAKGRKGWIR